MMEPVEVTVHFDAQGRITPLSFSWKGGNYRVESAGRRWQDEDGEHILVMVPGSRIYELVFKSGEGRWYLSPARPSRMVV